MTNTKTLMLAAVAALSLGAGAAMAQESPSGFTPGSAELLLPSERNPAAFPGYAVSPSYSRQAATRTGDAVHSGGADVAETMPGLMGGGG